MVVIKSIFDQGWQSSSDNSEVDKAMFDKLSMFYQSCTNESVIDGLGDAPLITLLKQVTTTALDALSLTETLAKLHDMDVDALFDSGVQVDLKASTKHIVVVSQPELGLEAKEHYTNTEMMAKYRDLIEEAVHIIFPQLGQRFQNLKWKDVAKGIAGLEASMADASMKKSALFFIL